MSNLKAARQLAGLTQYELAEAVGVTQPIIVYIEQGGGAREDRARRIAAAVGQPLADIFPGVAARIERREAARARVKAAA